MTVEAHLTINAPKAAVWAATTDIAYFVWVCGKKQLSELK